MKQKTLAENVADLPKWAQHEIRVLQMRFRESKEELARIKENPKSNTLIGSPYIMGDETIQYLRDNQRISFKLEKGHIEVQIQKGYLSIHASGGQGELNIRPEASNVIQLHLK